MISGPSGVGKGTVVRELAGRMPVRFSVSATTRAPRPGERHGIDYHFLDEAEFDRWIADGELLEWARYSGHRYGTPRRSVLPHLEAGRDVVLDIEVQGAAQIRAAFPASVLVFLRPPSMEELERRLRARGDTVDIERRLEVAAHELDQSGWFDHVVVNDDLRTAVDELEAILTAPTEVP